VGATVSASGNRYVFAQQPTVTVKTINASKTYGDDGTTDLTPYYTITGLSAGVAGAYRADSAASILSGAVPVSSDGLAATANANPYSYTLGSLTAGSGYAISLLNTGTLTVAARPITLTAAAKTSVYGDATPSLTYSITSGDLVNGNTLSGSLATTATSASAVGGYDITQGTLAASANYVVTYVGATLSITARPITVTADAKSRAYGAENPALTYTVGGSGLANGETLTGLLATAADTASPNGTYAITQGSLQASANYAMTFVPGSLTVFTPASTIRAPGSMSTMLASTAMQDVLSHTASTSTSLIPLSQPLTVTSGGNGGGTVFSSPLFDGVSICPGGDCGSRIPAQRL